MRFGLRRRGAGRPLAARPARVARAIGAALVALTLLAACRSGPATPTPPSAAASASPTVRAGTPSGAASPLRVLATPATPLPATPSATETTVQVIAPFKDGALVPAYNRTESIVGTCIGPSLASPARADAWRCVANGTTQLRDPCFALGGEAQPPLICFRQPWNNGVTLLVLSAPLPEGRAATADPTTPNPWGLELADGTRCTAATEATTIIAGQQVIATCMDGTSVIGAIDRSQRLWSVLAIRDRNSQPEREPIARAWY